jgi:phospholipase/carboxylesterase
LSYAIALSHPEKINKVIALSGYINEEILEENYRNNDFSKLSIFASHRVVDQVIPVTQIGKTTPFLDTLEIDSIYKNTPLDAWNITTDFTDFKIGLNNKKRFQNGTFFLFLINKL